MFEVFVELYRAIGSPPFVDGKRLSVRCEVTAELQTAIDKYKNSSDKLVEVDFDFDGEFVDVTFKVPSSEKGALFHDENDFLRKTLTLAKGEFRENFYIVSSQYYCGDQEVPEEIARIKRVTEFILYLRKFAALSIDEEQSMKGDRIFFLKPSDGKSPQKAAALKINITASAFLYDLGRYKILNDLVKSFKDQKPQIEERILIMNSAISHILDECENDDEDFEFLIKNWERVKKKYLHDLQAYLSAFSFDAVKKKISDGLIESTTKINNAIGEVATKLLAVPASLGALILVSNSTSTASFVVGVIGVLIASLIILRTIWHYKNQVDNLAASFAFNMKEATKSKKSFSRSIQEEVKRIDDFQRKQKESIGFSFLFYNVVASLPILGCIYYVVQALWPVILGDYSLYTYCLTFNII